MNLQWTVQADSEAPFNIQCLICDFSGPWELGKFDVCSCLAGFGDFLLELLWKPWVDAICSRKPHSAAFVSSSKVTYRWPLTVNEKGSVQNARANPSIYYGTRGLNTIYLLFAECLFILSSPACSWVSCPRCLKNHLIFHCEAICNLFLQVMTHFPFTCTHQRAWLWLSTCFGQGFSWLEGCRGIYRAPLAILICLCPFSFLSWAVRWMWELREHLLVFHFLS